MTASENNELSIHINFSDIASILKKIILGGIIFILALPLLGDYGLWLFPIGRDVIFKLTVELLWVLFLMFWTLKNLNLFRNSKLEIRNLKIPVAISLLIFWLIILASTLNSTQPDFSLWGNIYKNQGLMTWTHYLLFFFLLIFFIRDKKYWRTFINISIIIASLVSLVALWQIMMDGIDLRASATLNNPNYLAAYLILILPITFAIFLKKPSWWLGSAALLQFLALLFTQTRGGYLGIAVAFLIFIYLFFSKKQEKLINAPKFLILLSALLLISSYGLILFTSTGQSFQQKLPGFTDRFFNYQTIKNNSAPRIEAWRTGWQAMLEKPLLGYGPENFFVAYDNSYSGFLDDTGSLAKEGSLWETWFDKAHNFIFDIGATMGFLGLFAYISIFISVIWVLAKDLKFKISARGGSASGRKDFLPTGDVPKGQGLINIGLIAAFGGYLAQNLLGFDTLVPGIYLMFLLGYSHFLVNSKHEARNPKQYLNSNDLNSKPEFRTLEFRIFHLFRISDIKSRWGHVPLRDFVFRIFVICITLITISLFILSFKAHLNILRANHQLNLAESFAQKGKIDQSFAAFEKGLFYNSSPINPNLRRRYAVIALAYYGAVEKRCPANPSGSPRSRGGSSGSPRSRGGSSGSPRSRGGSSGSPNQSAAADGTGQADPAGLDCAWLFDDSKKYLARALELQYESAAAEWPRFTRNYIYAAQISHILGDYENSDVFFEKALELSPGRTSIQTEWTRLRELRSQ